MLISIVLYISYVRSDFIKKQINKVGHLLNYKSDINDFVVFINIM